MTAARAALIWTAVAVAVLAPLVLVFASPLLAWRSGVYILAGVAGVLAMGLLLLQPLLALGALPRLTPRRSRLLHRAVGAAVVLAAVLHVGGLWLTSPPDVIDALLLVSPTPFSVWGVAALWALLGAAALAALRHRLRLSARTWRRAHATLALCVAAGTIVHVLLIEGTMEPVSKAVLALCIAVASVIAALRLAWPDTWRSIWPDRR